MTTLRYWMLNAEIGGFTNYYSIANNSSHLNSFKYIMQYSMYKTFCKKSTVYLFAES